MEIGGDPSFFVQLGGFVNFVTERFLYVRWRSGELFNEGNGMLLDLSDGGAGGDSFGCIGICSVITCDTSVIFDFAELHVGIRLEIVEKIK